MDPQPVAKRLKTISDAEIMENTEVEQLTDLTTQNESEDVSATETKEEESVTEGRDSPVVVYARKEAKIAGMPADQQATSTNEENDNQSQGSVHINDFETAMDRVSEKTKNALFSYAISAHRDVLFPVLLQNIAARDEILGSFAAEVPSFSSYVLQAARNELMHQPPQDTGLENVPEHILYCHGTENDPVVLDDDEEKTNEMDIIEEESTSRDKQLDSNN